MATAILALHIMVCLAMIALILLQRSEGGALGMGGGTSSFMTGRGAANLLTRTTSILAAVFFTTSLILGILSHRPKPSLAVEGGQPVTRESQQPANVPAEKAPEQEPLPKFTIKRPAAPAQQAPAEQKPAVPQVPQSQ